MKKTELNDVYCVPKTGEDFRLLKPHIDSFQVGNSAVAAYFDDYFDAYASDVDLEDLKYSTEIPVSKFVDLLEDRIVGWRLEEIGFNKNLANSYYLNIRCISVWYYTTNHAIVIEDTNADDIPTSIKTFTELETLIRFLR